MMAVYVTKAELRKFAAEISLTERASVRKAAHAEPLTGATFLSHSSKDEDLVTGATLILKNHGARVYTDEVDPEMPPYTCTETGALLKDRINQTKRFVLLATPNSKESRWVPWELGIADGCKGLSNIALFPAAESANDKGWASWEYLGIYRRIVWGKLEGHNGNIWMVHDEVKNTGIELRTWLS